MLYQHWQGLLLSQIILGYKTFFSQEMLNSGFLASTSCFSSTAHSDDELEKYTMILNKIFDQITKFEDGEKFEDNLETPICHDGFKS